MMTDIRFARLGDAEAIARVHVDSWRSTYRGMMPDKVLDDLDYDQRASFWRQGIEGPPQSTFLLVAEEGGEIIGFAAGGPQRTPEIGTDGEVYAIYLLAEHQGRGIGKALMRASAELLRESGFTSMALWVLKDNPAEQFYEAVGGIRQDGFEEFELGGATLLEVGYVWPDLAGWLKEQG